MGGEPGLELPEGELFGSGDDIRALYVVGDDLYWVNHGSYDSLGNYLNDGALYKRALGSDLIEMVAGQLQGPVEARVSDKYAYVFLDAYFTTKKHAALVRIPLVSGELELVQLDAVPDCHFQCLLAAGGRAYWSHDSFIYSIDEGPDALPELLVERTTPGPDDILDYARLDADESYLYFTNADSMLRMPHAGGEPEIIAERPWGGVEPTMFYFVASGGFVYALDNPEDIQPPISYLQRVPVAGGEPWFRIASFEQQSTSQLQVVDGVFFLTTFTDDHVAVTYGSALDPVEAWGDHLTLPPGLGAIWAAHPSGLFWTVQRNVDNQLVGGTEIYFTPRPEH